MMASKRFPALFVSIFSVSCLLSLALPAASTQTEGIVPWRSVKGLFRSKRQACVDGTYEHNGKSCCLCGIGMRLEKPCSVSADDGECRPCDVQTYNSDPNYKSSCEPCTSCNQPNANLEEAEPCTPARDTRCKCKNNHYCGTEPCKVCQPCKKCGSEGIKVACTAINNTICNDKIEGNQTGLIIGIIAAVIIVALIVGAVVWKKRKSRPETNPGVRPQDQLDVEMQPLRDIQPYLPDIAETLGWKDMKNVAMRSKINEATIQSCILNHRDDSREQTLELLKIWVEKHGSNAPRDLVKILLKADKRAKAEKVRDILTNDNTISSNTPA